MITNYELEQTGEQVQNILNQAPQTAIDLAAEVLNRENADTALQGDIDDIEDSIGTDTTPETIKGRIKELEDNVGTGGSVDQRIAAVVGDAGSDYDTLGKLEDKLQDESTTRGNADNALDGRVDTLETAVGTGGSVDERIAAAKSEVIGDAAAAYNTLGKVEDKIQDETSARQQADTAMQGDIDDIEDAIGTDGTTGTIKGRITAAEYDIDNVEAEIGSDDAAATVKGRITSLESAVNVGGSIDQRIATAKSEVIGDASTDYNTLGKAEDKIQEESTARENADSAIIGDAATAYNTLGKLEDKIQEEASARENADNTLQGNIDDVNEAIGTDGTTGTIKGRIAALEYDVNDSAGTVDTRIATAKSEVIGDAAAAYNTLGKLEDQLQTLDNNVDQRLDSQDAQIALLNGSEVIIVADHTAVESPVANKIYREPESVVAPASPTYYIDWMWDTTQTPPAWKEIAKYDFPGLDDEPTPGSQNLVKSGGVAASVVYDISAANSGATYADLAAALDGGNNIPESIRKGGMSIKFVQSSDNKYIQARCMAQNFTTDVTQWQSVYEEPVAGSKNLVESGGIYNSVKEVNDSIYGDVNTLLVDETCTEHYLYIALTNPIFLRAGNKLYYSSSISAGNFMLYSGTVRLSETAVVANQTYEYTAPYDVTVDKICIYSSSEAFHIEATFKLFSKKALPTQEDINSLNSQIDNTNNQVESNKRSTDINKSFNEIAQSDLRVGAWDDNGNAQLNLNTILTNSAKIKINRGERFHIKLGTKINRFAYKIWSLGDGSLTKSTWITKDFLFEVPFDGIVVFLFSNTDSDELQVTDYDATFLFGNAVAILEQGSWDNSGNKEASSKVIRTGIKYSFIAGKKFVIIPGSITDKVFYRFFPYNGSVVQPSGWQTDIVRFTAPSDGQAVFIFSNSANSEITPDNYDSTVFLEEYALKDYVSCLQIETKNLIDKEADIEERVTDLEQSEDEIPLQIVNPYMNVFKSIPSTEINEEFQSFCKVGNEFWIASGGSGDGGSMQGSIYRYDSSWNYIGKMDQTGFHFNSMSYDEGTDRLITGCVTGSGSNNIYIFNNISDWPTVHASTPITSSDVERIISLSQITAYTNPVWAERNAEGYRSIIVSGNLNAKFIKIELGYGTDNFSYGTYTASNAGVPNGTYKLKWNRDYTVPNYIKQIGALLPYGPTVCQDIDYYKGKIYAMTSVTPSTLMELTPTETGFATRAIHQLWCDNNGTVKSNCANEGIMCLDGKVYVGISAIGEAGSTSITAYNNKILCFDL